MYLIKNKGLEIPAEELNIPYYFCVDSSLRISSFFIPQVDKQELSEKYLITTFKNFVK